jgi:hypothetical protein
MTNTKGLDSRSQPGMTFIKPENDTLYDCELQILEFGFIINNHVDIGMRFTLCALVPWRKFTGLR